MYRRTYLCWRHANDIHGAAILCQPDTPCGGSGQWSVVLDNGMSRVCAWCPCVCFRLHFLWWVLSEAVLERQCYSCLPYHRVGMNNIAFPLQPPRQYLDNDIHGFVFMLFMAWSPQPSNCTLVLWGAALYRDVLVCCACTLNQGQPIQTDWLTHRAVNPSTYQHLSLSMFVYTLTVYL